MAALVPKTLSFAESAPWTFDFDGHFHATTAEVWAAFVDNESWTKWFKNCRACRATSTPFGGVGSTRHIEVNGLSVDEEFIGWEPERLWAFTAVSMRFAFARSLVERVEFEADPDGTSRVRYRMAIAPRWWAKPLRAVLRKQATSSFAASFAKLDEHLATVREAGPRDG